MFVGFCTMLVVNVLTLTVLLDYEVVDTDTALNNFGCTIHVSNSYSITQQNPEAIFDTPNNVLDVHPSLAKLPVVFNFPGILGCLTERGC